MKIVEYCIVNRQSIEALNFSINEQINLGRQPFGVPFHVDTGFMQAMVKYEKEYHPTTAMEMQRVASKFYTTPPDDK